MIRALALGALVGLACSPFQKTPAGFLELDRTRFDYQALSADNVVLVGRHYEPGGGSLEYWTEVIRKELVTARGYTIVREEPVKAGGVTGRRFTCAAMREGTEFVYLLSVFYVPDWIYDDVYTVEAGGKKAQVERHRAAVDAFVAGLEL